jgi:hypothetical protein
MNILTRRTAFLFCQSRPLPFRKLAYVKMTEKMSTYSPSDAKVLKVEPMVRASMLVTLQQLSAHRTQTRQSG